MTLMPHHRIISFFLCLSLAYGSVLSLAGCACTGTIESDLSRLDTSESQAPLRELPSKLDQDEPEINEEEITYGDSRDELVAIITTSEERRIGGIPTYEEYAQGTADTTEIQNTILSLIEAYGANASVAVRYLPNSAWDFSVNGEVSHPAASLIGLALLTQIYDRIDSGTLSLDNEYILTESSIVGGNGTLQNEEVGSMVSLDELIRHMLEENDNTATNMLIDIVGFEATNLEFQRQGLDGSSLSRYMMDTSAQENGSENWISADDVADILAAAAQNIFYNRELSEMTVEQLKLAEAPSSIAQTIADERAVATKSGNLDNVVNEAAIIEGERPYVLVVLIEGLAEQSAQSLIADITRVVDAWALS